MTLNFDWSYFWSYYQRVPHPAVQANMRAEILADGWLFDQSADIQIAVLKEAPKEFIESVRGSLKPYALAMLKPKLIDWSKL